MTAGFFVQTYMKNVGSCKKLIKELKRQAKMKKEDNTALDLQLTSMQVTAAERRNVYEATGNWLFHFYF